MNDISIAVDAMGGDNAPRAICEGTLKALREMNDIRVTLCGRQAEIRPFFEGADDIKDRLTLLDAPDVITMHDAPMLAVRRKTESSMVKAMLEVKEGRCQAFVSAGSTGAVLAGGILRVGRIRGIERPALAPVLPGRKKPFLLIDCGANVDCRAEYLNQFGLMGTIYMEKIVGAKEPCAGLVNIGTEAEKGCQMVKDAYKLMSGQSVYRFYGNLEARDVPLGEADVAVCDGFVGNVILKYTEGLAGTLTGMLKDTIMESGLRGKLGGLLLKPALRVFKSKMNYE